MDANGTTFHLLLGRDDWMHCLDEHGDLLGNVDATSPFVSPEPERGLSWDPVRNMVSLKSYRFDFTPPLNDRRPTISDRRGSARDRFGNWFWLSDDESRILVNSAGNQKTSDFWPVASTVCQLENRDPDEFHEIQPAQIAAPLKLQGLAITEDHFLVVGTLEPKGLLVFDLFVGGPPRQMLWPLSVSFEPFDIATRKGGGVWILDRVNRCYWFIDRHFQVCRSQPVIAPMPPESPDDFTSTVSDAGDHHFNQGFPEGIPLGDTPATGSTDPIAIEGFAESEVLILDGSPEGVRVHRYRQGQRVGSVGISVAFHMAGYDFVFIQSTKTAEVMGELFVAANQGNQAYRFEVRVRGDDLALTLVEEYLPMRLFGGKALVNASGTVYYDSVTGWVPLVFQPRPRYATEGVLLTPIEAVGNSSVVSPDESTRHAFDAREPDCVWHRLMLDATIPPEASVQIWSRAANTESDLESSMWQREPGPLIRRHGSELPFFPVRKDGTRSGTWELLFQNACGRYFQLKLVLEGNGRVTPRLWALRVYYPRFSYLARYLPAVYREDDVSSSFLDRFLANFEGSLTALEDMIANVQMLFDIRSAPAEALDWLAEWLGVVLDPAWDEARRRLFIKHAMKFFQERGTIPGLERVLRMAFDECDESVFNAYSAVEVRAPRYRIVERFLVRGVPAVVQGDPSDLTDPRKGDPSHRWTPLQGREELIARYLQFLAHRYPLAGPLPTTTAFPLSAPRIRMDTLKSYLTLTFTSPAGSEALIVRLLWKDFLQRRYKDAEMLAGVYGAKASSYDLAFLPEALENGAAASRDLSDFVSEYSVNWEYFCRDALGFVPSGRAGKEGMWQDYLSLRYTTIRALNETYGLVSQPLTSFQNVPLPATLPPEGQSLMDWYQFEGIVVATSDAAHRFSVLLPVRHVTGLSSAERQEKIDWVKRIIELEKPAHAIFDVKFYWDLFRVGEARVGLDTHMERGSRDPSLMPPLVLGREYLAESYLTRGFPRHAEGRYVLGEGSLGSMPH
jgi:phage tail-like protein